MVGLLIWRWRRTHKDAARARPPFRGALYPLHGVTRAAQPLPGPRAAIERPQEAHLHLLVPKTSSMSRDQAIFVDRAAGASVLSDAVLLKIDRFG